MSRATGQHPFFTRIEGLRGVGALAVAGYHMSGWALHGVPLLPYVPWEGVGPVQNAMGRIALALLPGHAALMTFFVISGFVLRISLQRGPQAPASRARRFLTARACRIYPIVACGTLVAALLHGWRVPAAPGRTAGSLTPGLFVANLLLLDVSLNGVLWALQVEVLMAPAILLLYAVERRCGVRALAAIAVVTTPLSFGNWLGWRPLSANFFCFVLGMLVPTLGRAMVTALSSGVARRAAGVILVCLVLPGPLIGFYSRFSAVIEALAAFVLVSMAAYRVDLGALSWLERRPLRLLGLASGSYYVLHMHLLRAPLVIAASLVPVTLGAGLPALVGPAVLLGSLAVIAPAAGLGYYLVEGPGIALGRRLTRQSVSPGSARAASPS